MDGVGVVVWRGGGGEGGGTMLGATKQRRKKRRENLVYVSERGDEQGVCVGGEGLGGWGGGDSIPLSRRFPFCGRIAF